MKGEDGSIEIEVPRDRDGSFEPRLIAKGQTRIDEVKEWRSRALDTVYPIVIFDALRVKIRDKGSRIVRNKAVYLALGVTDDVSLPPKNWAS